MVHTKKSTIYEKSKKRWSNKKKKKNKNNYLKKNKKNRYNVSLSSTNNNCEQKKIKNHQQTANATTFTTKTNSLKNLTTFAFRFKTHSFIELPNPPDQTARTLQSHVKVNEYILRSLSVLRRRKMHSRASQNRLSGSSFGSRISALLLAMFATMATVYVAGRLVFFFFFCALL